MAREVPAFYHESGVFGIGVVERGVGEFCKQVSFRQHLPQEHIVAVLFVPIVVVVGEASPICFPRIVLAEFLSIVQVLDASQMLRLVHPTDLQRRTAIVYPAVASEPMFAHVVAREVGVQLVNVAHLLVGETLSVLAHSGHYAPVVPSLEEHSCCIVAEEIVTCGNLILCM